MTQSEFNKLLEKGNNEILNAPFNAGGISARNRILFQAMEGCDGEADGSAGELTVRRYDRFAAGGAGIIWFEATAVCPRGRANPRQLWLHEGNIDSFAKTVRGIKEKSMRLYGFAPLVILQLTHSGRFSKPEPISAFSADREYIKSLPDMFVKSSRLAREAGFDGVDVKCCHGYLFNEFLFAYGRTDEYGGEETENRTRVYSDTVKAVFSEILPPLSKGGGHLGDRGDSNPPSATPPAPFNKGGEICGSGFIVTSRFNAHDGYVEREPDLAERFTIIEKLRTLGMTMINITAGCPYINPHVNRPYTTDTEDGMIGVGRMAGFTAEIQQRFPDMAAVLSAPTYLREKALDFSANMINSGYAAFAGFGRMTFAYPMFYRDFVDKGAMDPSKVCITCAKCSQLMRAGGVTGCPIRDSEVYMPLYRQYVLGERK